jgi:glutamate-1-semialdehyde 2,1-aminomutase
MDQRAHGLQGMAELLAEAEAVFPGRSTGSYAVPPWMDIVVGHAEGSRLHAMNGRAYLDYILGSGPLVLGHAHPAVVTAVQAQVARGSTYYALNEPVIGLGRTIRDAVPCAEKVFFASSGAEATYLALRLARAFTGRELILRFAGGYHGHHDYVSTESAGVPKSVAETVLVAPFDDLDAVRHELTAHRSEVAAVLVEPVNRVTPPRPGFLEALKRVTHESGALLIFDEVVTGFRLAWGGAQARFGVTPDLATYGKIIGGGYALSAVCGPRDVLDLVSPRRRGEPNYVFFSGTLSGNPIAAAAGRATLSELAKPGVYERLDHVGETLRRGFNAAARDARLPLVMTGVGAINGVLIEDGAALSKEARTDLLPRLGRALFERGIASNLHKVYVSLVHSDADLNETVEGYREVLREAATWALR